MRAMKSRKLLKQPYIHYRTFFLLQLYPFGSQFMLKCRWIFFSHFFSYVTRGTQLITDLALKKLYSYILLSDLPQNPPIRANQMYHSAKDLVQNHYFFKSGRSSTEHIFNSFISSSVSTNIRFYPFVHKNKSPQRLL